MAAIDIGTLAIDRAGGAPSSDSTVVCIENPANDSGSITYVEIWLFQTGNVEVATFIDEGSNVLSTRDSENLGSVSSGSKQTFSGLDMTVVTGDFLGFYSFSGRIVRDTFGSGYWNTDGDWIPCSSKGFGFNEDRTISLYGTGSTPIAAPTVTTQAVDDILSATATGHGNITATGGENSHTRGICWNTGGAPTTGDSKSEDNGGGSYSTGAFPKAMTGLTPEEHYYVRAYAINSAGTSYGNEVEFDTLSAGVTANKSANMGAKMIAGKFI